MIVLIPLAGFVSGPLAAVLLVFIALIGSGLLGYVLDRRSAQATRLAIDAVEATGVFKESLSEEHDRIAALRAELTVVRSDLTMALARVSVDASEIERLKQRMAFLEDELRTAEAKVTALRAKALSQ